jgi:uncharacterized membrane protein YagU involved in acid resistance
MHSEESRMTEDSMILTQRFPLIPILLGGLIAGTIDIEAASLINKVNPALILQVIAGGVLGKASFRMGLTSVIFGLGLQLAMSVLIAAIYVGAARRLPMLKRRWIGAGLAYGVAIYLVMNYVVVPLSAAKMAKFSVVGLAANLLAMLLFGLIVAFCARDTAWDAA